MSQLVEIDNLDIRFTGERTAKPAAVG